MAIIIIKKYHTVHFFFSSWPVSALCFPLNNLQIRAVLVLWFRWLCPGGLWESVKAAGRKGDDCCVTEDVNQPGWTRQLSLLTYSHSLSDVAVVPLELSLDCPAGTTKRKHQLSSNSLNIISLVHVLYEPVPHAIEAVPNDYHQRKTSCTPVLPQKVVVQGFPTMHQVKECGLSHQALALLHKTVRQKAAVLSVISYFPDSQ